MAGEMVGGAFLSAFLQVLFDRMASRDIMDFIQGRKLNGGLLNKLKVQLLSVDAVLNDAEERQTSNLNVKEWLNELKDAFFQAEDIIDEITTEATSHKLEPEIQSSTSKVRNFFNSPPNRFDKRIEIVLDRLEFLVKQKDALGLKNGVSELPTRKFESTSVVESSGVFGRDSDKNSIIEFLLADDSSDHKISILAIVGMAGVGKTTLAQLVYNDNRVKEHFSVKVWVGVSQEFDVFRVTKTILEAIPLTCDEAIPLTCDAMDLNRQQVKLKEFLTKKKFLIVLDDMWNENYSDWEILKRPFEFGALGSKIIVTTRSQHVASIMCTVPNHYLKQLTDDDCWLVFAKHAFEDGNFTYHPTLDAIGREIVKKCKGLPLAAKALGGLLRSKVDPKAWVKVLHSAIWDLSHDNILPALMLSYHYLPSPLKRCFAYCAIFPKNFVFRKQDLVQLWIAEDLLLHPKINGDKEAAGVEYFNDLVSRSFFQPLGRKKSCFIMHDLIHDLAEFVSGEFSLRLESGKTDHMSIRTRHLSYSKVQFGDSQTIKAICEAKGLRTFLPSEVSSRSRSLSNEAVSELLSGLRSLRVLSLSHCHNLTIIPDSIGNLVHLRYLNLSHTAIKKLPDSMCSLYNLQTLLLTNCGSLTALPVNMGRLINLRCLDVTGTNLSEMPLHMGRLENLQILTVFSLGKRSGSSIQELKGLQCLKGKLSILNLQNVVDPKDAMEAGLKDKKQLNDLVLKWSGDVDDSQKDRDVLCQLQPPKSLTKLTIEHYGGTKFPDWLGDRKFSNMASIYLHGCKYCMSLPPLGQLPSLKHLALVGFDVPCIDAQFYGDLSSEEIPFRSLQTLRFENMLEWQEWVPFTNEKADKSFPCLQKLCIQNCPNLMKGLPRSLPSLTKLVITKCQQLVAVLPRTNAVCAMQLEYCEKVSPEELPPQLLKLTVGGYDSLEFLFEGTGKENFCIEKLNVSCCQSLKRLPNGSMADTIGSLNITNCGKIDFPMYECFASLESLYIKCSCDSLKSFILGFFPKLNHLHIHGSQNLESISVSRDHVQYLTSLNSLRISACPNFLSFPDGGLPATNLTYFRIDQCEKLRSLPEQMNLLLSSLVTLTIWHCPELESFPEGGLPSSLQSLEISYCDRLFASRKNWNLQILPSLGSFGIRGKCEDGESFPEKELLPSTLTSLYILKLQNLKSLCENGLQELTSLENLGIGSCSKLQFMPANLPASLSDLHIWDCPLLKQRCQRKQGEDWQKIAHISRIRIDKKLI